jgi:hypothetical protein
VVGVRFGEVGISFDHLLQLRSSTLEQTRIPGCKYQGPRHLPPTKSLSKTVTGITDRNVKQVAIGRQSIRAIGARRFRSRWRPAGRIQRGPPTSRRALFEEATIEERNSSAASTCVAGEGDGRVFAFGLHSYHGQGFGAPAKG